ncbi:hypothetical protein PV728_45590 [Streptomyces europaeiscabiei]|uniref:hypothetical protein n=1 Tax=Streptomyces europaeiscabiei TaxID=146819 RepID=UPI0029A6836A|nr:hypothetical protein [Streptomyces europaeiscabiei]MDX3637344.1 hypothetical protein [Streptomyces europaeiscabiei]MDX3655285.1 hypothetical protein [Streptomyces europaeiscabiei]
MSADELAAVVAELGALPMPVPVVPEPLGAERLAEIEARADAATAGPWCTDAWEIYQGVEYVPGISFWIGETCRGTSELGQDRADAAFVAAARSDVPALVAEVRRQAARIAELERTVQQMVDGLNGHDCPPPDETPMGAVTRFAVRLMEAERLLAELEAAPTFVYRAEHPDSGIVLGVYSTRDAAAAHCEALATREGATGLVSWVPDDGDALSPEELTYFDVEYCDGDDVPVQTCTGYVVTPLVIADEHESGADE